MPTAENASLEYENGQTSFPMTALTNSGDRKLFTSTAALWSGRAGYDPVVRPDGILTGGAVTPAAGNNAVSVAALTANLAGAVEVVAAEASVSITRPTGNVAKITSITVDSAGDIVAVAGTDGAGATFSETRGAAGGPPFIPVGSIEVAQVRVNTETAAPITAAQVFQVPNIHRENAGFPNFETLPDIGAISFFDALPAIHTGNLPKGVYASFAEPIFVPIELASDFVPAEESYSSSSTQVYNGRTVGAASKSLQQASFTAYLADGVSDDIVQLKGENLWFRFFPNNYRTSHKIMTQGILGVGRAFPAGDNISAACTISAQRASFEVID